MDEKYKKRDADLKKEKEEQRAIAKKQPLTKKKAATAAAKQNGANRRTEVVSSRAKPRQKTEEASESSDSVGEPAPTPAFGLISLNETIGTAIERAMDRMSQQKDEGQKQSDQRMARLQSQIQPDLFAQTKQILGMIN